MKNKENSPISGLKLQLFDAELNYFPTNTKILEIIYGRGNGKTYR